MSDTTVSISLICDDSGQDPEFYGFEEGVTAEQILADMKNQGGTARSSFHSAVEDYDLVENSIIRVEVWADGHRTLAEWKAWEYDA